MRLVFLTAALAAAVAVLVAISLPPPRVALAGRHDDDGTVPGILHVHTDRSDGRGSTDAVAAAAARAGLKFLVFTDHGNATRAPDPPTYREGVLCLDGVEISTSDGHYIALDMPASPYPLGGEARDVVEDVRRLGGFGVVAHPDSPKLELRWREWTAPFDAMEIVNPDTSWRVHAQQPGWRPKLRLLEALAAYPFRPGETIAGLLVDSPGSLARWEELTRRRRVVALAGVDAHAKLELKNVEPGDNRYSLPLPSYDALFRTLSVHIRPDRPLSGVAAADAALIVRAIRTGRLYTAVDGLASPPSFAFTARNSLGTAEEGGEITAGGPVTLRVRSNAPARFTTTVWQGSRLLGTGHDEPELTLRAPEDPAVYRVEIRASDRLNQPAWIVSNPIYVRRAAPAGKAPTAPPAVKEDPLFDGVKASALWRVEHDPTSLAALDIAPAMRGAELRMRYGLSGGPAAGQYAALVVDTPNGLAPNDRLSFTTRAEQPMRISVQLRAPEPNDLTQRWQRSVYVEPLDRDRTIYFDDMTPVGDTRTGRPVPADVRSIIFAIELTNTDPGSSGRLWIKRAVLQR